MRSTVSLALSAIVILGLAACGSSGPASIAAARDCLEKSSAGVLITGGEPTLYLKSKSLPNLPYADDFANPTWEVATLFPDRRALDEGGFSGLRLWKTVSDSGEIVVATNYDLQARATKSLSPDEQAMWESRAKAARRVTEVWTESQKSALNECLPGVNWEATQAAFDEEKSY